MKLKFVGTLNMDQILIKRTVDLRRSFSVLRDIPEVKQDLIFPFSS